MATSIERIEDKISTQSHGNEGSHREKINDDGQTEKKEIIIIGHSNTKYMKPDLIHHEKKVSVETCYYLEDAIKKQGPMRQEPDKVTDFVVMTGLNDSKDVKTPVSTVMNRMQQTCQKYEQRFKNAQIYVAAVAPVNPKQRNLNNQLKEYADNQGYEFVDNNALFDKDSGHLRDKMLDGIHYTKLGFSHVAGQLKRKLYSKDNPKPAQSAKEKSAHGVSWSRKVQDNSQRNMTASHVSGNSAEKTNGTNQNSNVSPAARLLTRMESFFEKAETALAAPDDGVVGSN